MQFLRRITKMKEGETLSWRLMKLALALVWLYFLFPVLRRYHEVPLPVGICAYVPCDFFRWKAVGILLSVAALLLAFLYVSEYRMRSTLFFMALISVLGFSLEESNGIYNRTAILSALMLVQLLAYVFRKHKSEDAVSFSRQIVAAVYTLAGLSKLKQSGFTWSWDAPNLLLQMKKGAYYAYFDTGDTTALQFTQKMTDLFDAWPLLLYGGLTLTFALELCSFIILINARTAFWYGVLLLLMHLGIYCVMGIVIRPIVFPMIVILLNPLYIISRLLPPKRRYGRREEPLLSGSE